LWIEQAPPHIYQCSASIPLAHFGSEKLSKSSKRLARTSPDRPSRAYHSQWELRLPRLAYPQPKPAWLYGQAWLLAARQIR
jgi:hypothetical protein